ncbi:YfhO family protein, partial [Corallococcus sp. 4LFB]|uniref:YfhO family protein n=1 Tax=Corallococcus sp. 4LFB TaxID=3383249 RepID=UPI003975F704
CLATSVAGAVAGAVLASACAALVLLRERPALQGALLVALQWGALMRAHEPLYQLSPEELLTTPPVFVERIRALTAPGESVRVASSLRDLPPPPRLAGLRHNDALNLLQLYVLAPDMVALWGLESANEYLPGVSPRVRQLKADRVHWFTRLAPRLGTRFIAFATAEQRELGARLSARSTFVDPLMGLTLVEYADAAPRIHLARPECVQGRAEALRRMMSPQLPPPDVAIVECQAPLPPTPEGPLGSIHVAPGTPEHLTVEVASLAPAVLVVNDAWQPGWRATVDGQDVPILPADVAVRAVVVPAGQHRVELRYRTPGLTAGLLLGALSWLGLALACLGRRFVPRRRAAA